MRSKPLASPLEVRLKPEITFEPFKFLLPPSSGKAPRKQLATKAARKTAAAAVRRPNSRRHRGFSHTDQLATYRLPLVVSRSLTVSVPELSPFVKSEGTRSPLSSSFASSPSNVLFVKSLRISRSVFSEPPLLQDESAILMTPLRSYLTPCRPISVSSPPLSWPFRKLPRPTSSPSSRTPTWLPFTLSVSLSNPRIWLVVSCCRGPHYIY